MPLMLPLLMFPFDASQDINDNMPKFEAQAYKFSVKEGEKGQYFTSQKAVESS